MKHTHKHTHTHSYKYYGLIKSYVSKEYFKITCFIRSEFIYIKFPC